MKQKISLIFIIIFLNSCSLFWEPMPKSWNWGSRARPTTGVRGFPETDTDYGKGFKNGCDNGWSSSTKGKKDLDKHVLEPALMSSSPDYNTGWWDGYEQCVYIVDWDVL